MSVTRPLLRYHGGKWILADWIIAQFPPHRVYVEPYGGAGSVLLQKSRVFAECYNDLDGELVNLFRVLRTHGDDLVNALHLTPFSRDEYRLSFKPDAEPLEQARRTVIRSFMGFGSNALCRRIKSGFRANSQRSGTTPAHDWVNYPKALDGIIDRMRGVVIENRNAVEVLESFDSEQTLFYCDPPYVHSTRSAAMHGFHGYNHEMTDDEHRTMAKALRSVRGMVVLSGYACELYDDELFSDWDRCEREAMGDGAVARTEVLWFSPNVRERHGLFGAKL